LLRDSAEKPPSRPNTSSHSVPALPELIAHSSHP
jgi:hypothetical protein